MLFGHLNNNELRLRARSLLVRGTKASSCIKFSETKTRVPGEGEFIGVPGELRGFELAWKKYGSMPWKDLFDPAIKIASEGFKATHTIISAVEKNAANVSNDPGLR